MEERASRSIHNNPHTTASKQLQPDFDNLEKVPTRHTPFFVIGTRVITRTTDHNAFNLQGWE